MDSKMEIYIISTQNFSLSFSLCGHLKKSKKCSGVGYC